MQPLSENLINKGNCLKLFAGSGVSLVVGVALSVLAFSSPLAVSSLEPTRIALLSVSGTVMLQSFFIFGYACRRRFTCELDREIYAYLKEGKYLSPEADERLKKWTWKEIRICLLNLPNSFDILCEKGVITHAILNNDLPFDPQLLHLSKNFERQKNQESSLQGDFAPVEREAPFENFATLQARLENPLTSPEEQVKILEKMNGFT